MGIDYETGRINLDRLIKWADENDNNLQRNESDTRLHLIDQLLFECLGWDREDCTTEQRYEGKFTDYELGAPEHVCIWEAKREGVYFVLPAGLEKRIYKLRTVFDGNADIEAAVKQCVQYCQERGVGVGVVCNGHQIVGFLGSRQDGVPPLDGSCLVFSCLQDVAVGFRELWQALSKPGLSARNMHVLLKHSGFQPPPEKLSQRILNYPGFKDRNPFQLELQILGELFLQDISQSPEVEQRFLVKGHIHAVQNLADRLERAETFRKYLDEQWKAFGDANIIFDWRIISPALEADVQRIRKRQEQLRK